MLPPWTFPASGSEYRHQASPMIMIGPPVPAAEVLRRDRHTENRCDPLTSDELKPVERRVAELEPQPDRLALSAAEVGSLPMSFLDAAAEHQR